MFDDLPETLEYTGEFGSELVLFLPFCCWLSKAGLLKNRKIVTYAGMRCFYEDLDCEEIVEKTEVRRYVFAEKRPPWLPIKNEHSFDGLGRSPFHFFPDLRSKFLKYKLLPEIGSAERPLLIIHNKYNDEWNAGPINFIPLECLDKMFRMFKNKFTTVYIRHGMMGTVSGFSEDHNAPLQFHDQDLLDAHPEVFSFDKLFESHVANGGRYDVNTFKNVLYSRCFHFISSQGGGPMQIAMFSGSILLILHRRGYEDRWAYRDGYFGFMARIPPILAVCSNYDDLIEAASLVSSANLADRQILVSSEDSHLLSRYSAAALKRGQI